MFDLGLWKDMCKLVSEKRVLRKCLVRKKSLIQDQLTKSKHPFVSFVSETFKLKEHALLASTQIYVGIKLSDTVWVCGSMLSFSAYPEQARR
jgi:hypothetical protein